jgi:Domain of unknown function (DUF4157)
MRQIDTQKATDGASVTESPAATPKTDHLQDPLASHSLRDTLVDSAPIQRQEEEEEVQAKSDSAPIQRQEEEEEEMQMKADEGAGASRATSFSNHGGEPLAGGLQDKMESSFGADFSNVRIHQDGAAADLGAKAFTQGNHIHVKPSQYNPESSTGQSLIGHELSHVQQQAAGRVAVQGKGLPINSNPALESEADRQGAQAAAGKRVR